MKEDQIKQLVELIEYLKEEQLASSKLFLATLEQRDARIRTLEAEIRILNAERA